MASRNTIGFRVSVTHLWSRPPQGLHDHDDDDDNDDEGSKDDDDDDDDDEGGY